MKWIKQIFGIKPDEDDVDVQSLEKFSNATKTNELVISPNTKSKADLKKLTKSSLNKLTKVQLEELAKSDFGLEIDRRKKKDVLITEILDAQ
jgi:hypothetical protein|tara:strand:- start:782 stop:1057 length:276 start_codon:yes stop_codon:yes gene_type:complete